MIFLEKEAYCVLKIQGKTNNISLFPSNNIYWDSVCVSNDSSQNLKQMTDKEFKVILLTYLILLIILHLFALYTDTLYALLPLT